MDELYRVWEHKEGDSMETLIASGLSEKSADQLVELASDGYDRHKERDQ